MTDRKDVIQVLRIMAQSYRILADSCDRAAEMLEEDTKIEPVIKFREDPKN